MKLGEFLLEQMQAQAVKQLTSAFEEGKSPQWVYDWLVAKYGLAVLRHSRHNFTQQKLTAVAQNKHGLTHSLAGPAGIEWLREIEAMLNELEER